MKERIYELLEELIPEAEAIKNNQPLATEQQQRLQELQELLNDSYAADVADLLESLPSEERSLLWHLTNPAEDGAVLLEVSDSLRESLIAEMDQLELAQVLEKLPAEDLVELYEDLPEDLADKALAQLDELNRAKANRALNYKEGTVGSIMDFRQENLIAVRSDVPCEVVLRYLRMQGKHNGGELPRKLDKVFVVDEEQRLCGTLSLRYLLASDPEVLVADRMLPLEEVIFFTPEEDGEKAGQAFEKYDLVSAPVVDEQMRIIGRLTVDDIMDLLREEAEEDMMNILGVRDEDLFAPIWTSLKNRGLWIGINLFTALLASRVIAGFSDIIVQLVALSALMPIVAGMAGNSGNQTITMIVRAMGTGQLSNWLQIRHLLAKELALSLINGIIWGSIIGLVAYFFYGDKYLSLVMMLAMIMNLLLAALLAVFIPFLWRLLRLDPAMGSSVAITACTDCGGFGILLILAKYLLLPHH